jgi:uncharacterized membrane protein
MPEENCDSVNNEIIGITIYVEGGCVQGVYTTAPENVMIDVELLDFDNERSSDEPDALDKAREQLQTIEKEQRPIF